MELPLAIELTEVAAQSVMHSLLAGLHRMLLPRLAVVRAHDDNLTFAAAHRCEMRHLQQHGAVETAVRRAHLEHTARQALAVVECRRMQYFLGPQHPAGDARWHRSGGRRHDDPQTGVPAPAHRTAACIHEEGHEEAGWRTGQVRQIDAGTLSGVWHDA